MFIYFAILVRLVQTYSVFKQIAKSICNEYSICFYCCGYINKKGIGEYYETIKVKYYNLIAPIKNFLNHSHDLNLVN